MKPEEMEYVKLRIERARSSLEEAQLLVGSDFLIGGVNRLYYACFYAVNALLFSENMSSAKHSGVISLFERNWIKTGRLPVQMGKFYRQLFERRQEGDYQDTTKFERQEVEKWLTQAQSFVECIVQSLRDTGIDV